MKLRVFLSSPGDVADERGIARQVLARLQQEAQFGARLLVEDVSWDNPAAPVPLAAWLSPQEAINQGRPKPADCDVVVVILWSRMGTRLSPDHVKPGNGGRYQSGTEWEFLNAVDEAERRRDGTPLVLVYRRTEKVLLDPDAADFKERTEQRQRLREFFEGFRDPDGSLRRSWHDYAAPADFEDLLERQLRDVFWRRLGSTGPTPGGAAAAAPRVEWQEDPYPGLRAFASSEAAIFFGRGRETDDLVARFTRDDARFLAVVGASGSGKSSLVAAGLLPRLAAGRGWTWVRSTPGAAGDDPFLALAFELAHAVPKAGWKPADLARRLENARAGTLADVVRAGLKEHPPSAELVLFMDQFEELFTLAGDPHRTPFVELIVAAADTPRLRIVVTLRADFYAHCTQWEPLVRLLRDGGSYPLGLPGLRALYEMITRPAEAAGLAFGDGLVDRLLEDTGTGPGALALLAFALHELYGARTAGKLTAAAYDAFGGVRRAIGKRAEDVFTSLPGPVQERLGDVFRELVEVDERGVATRRRIPRARLATSAELVDAFEEARLLVSDRGADGEPVVEVAHEALLREWDRLAKWVSDFADDLRLRQQAEAAARDWDRAGCDASHLWPHERLALVERALQRLGIPHTALEESARTFLRPEAERLLEELERPEATHFRRAEIGDRLDRIGDPRPGVGLRLDALPDIEWCPIPSGTVELEGVEGSFVVEPFAIAKYPVTYRQYRAFLDDPEGYRDKRWWKHLQHEKAPGEQWRPTGNCPADNVSWYDAMAYCRWLGERLGAEIRLPSEWEWQQAATGGRPNCEYPWGPEWIEGCANTWESHSSRTTAVGMYPRGASAHGVLDLAGNVWEWCLNTRESPRDSKVSGAGPRVVRGGSWFNIRDLARCAYRLVDVPVVRRDDLGFRVVRVSPIS